MTRKQLYRLLLALGTLWNGQPELFYWMLPAKEKRPYWWRTPPFMRWMITESLRRLAKYFDGYFSVMADVGSGEKIGDTFNVRMPKRLLSPGEVAEETLRTLRRPVQFCYHPRMPLKFS